MTDALGPDFKSLDSATGQVVWQGPTATAQEVDAALECAAKAFADWSSREVSQRIDVLHAFAHAVESRRDEIALLISQETGKPLWDARTEVDAMIAKPVIAIEAYEHRCASERVSLPNGVGRTHYRPHGVMAVLGPFNFPGHLPGSHMVPALLAGNTVVFKPSELTPGMGAMIGDLWQEAGAPDGVVRVVQGGASIGERLVASPRVSGVLFTGSYRVGVSIARALSDRPGTIVALELGGNNPILVDQPSDTALAARTVVVSAFLSSGQRCNCARRLIVVEDDRSAELIEQVTAQAEALRVGTYDQRPEPFMGPLIHAKAADRVLALQDELLEQGAESRLPAKQIDGHQRLLRPGILDITAVAGRPDEEVFGPLLQVVRVPTFDDAIAVANRTKYGLSASVLTQDRSRFQLARQRLDVGNLNWNSPTTGASSRLPFGGVGRSGNHRPSGYHAADFCSYPVASIERGDLPELDLPGIG